jgi:hypothetical protein
MLNRARDEAVLADLHLVAALEGDLVDAVPVDVRPVEAAHVRDRVAVRRTAELGVPARDRHVVEEDLALGVASGGDHLGVEEEAAAGARAALHDQQCAARRQRVDRGGVGVTEGALLAVLGLLDGAAEGDRRGGLAGRLPRRLTRGRGARFETAPALGAETCSLGVLVSALSAERHGRPPGASDLITVRANPQPSVEVHGCVAETYQ